MKGIIMAGGEGTRLRPLTCDCPKPMIRLMNRPVMYWAIALMKRHGIVDIAATLGYQPDAITDAFGDGGELGVRLQYFIERTPLGTAGGVRQAAGFLDETFVVLSGDGVTDLDIARAAAFHRERGALATLVLRRADNPMEYGVVDVDAGGRVVSFHEKPNWSEVLSDTVNTGIYILEPEVLERIPGDRPCDFGHELFPRMVKAGLPVYGFVTDDYWCDVGDARAYLAAHVDAMEGRVRLEGLPPMAGRAIQLPGAEVDRAAVLEGPCLIEAGARVCAGAYVGPYSVISEGCVVDEQASVKRGILYPGARLKPRAQARGCVLAAGAVLGEGAQAYEESVLGAGAVVDARGVLPSGVKLWPGKRVSEGERLDANRVWGGLATPGFHSGTLSASSPADAARAASACAAAMKPRELLLGRGSGPMAEALWHAAAAGCMAQNVRVLDAGVCALPPLRHVQRTLRADAAMLVDEAGVTPLDALGVPPEDRLRREILRLYARQDYPRPLLDGLMSVRDVSAATAGYIAAIAGLFTADPAKAMHAAICCDSTRMIALARACFDRAGLALRVSNRADDVLPGELGLTPDASGQRCGFRDACGPLTDAQGQLLAAWAALEQGERLLILPDNATRGVEVLARRYDARTKYISGEPARWMNALAGQHPLQFALRFDALALAATVLSLLAEKQMSLVDWRRDMPQVYLRSREVAIPPRQSGRILHAFAQARPDARTGGGIRFEQSGGWAWIGADETRPRLHIVAEGASSEFAGELCDFCERELKKLCDNTP